MCSVIKLADYGILCEFPIAYDSKRGYFLFSISKKSLAMLEFCQQVRAIGVQSILVDYFCLFSLKTKNRPEGTGLSFIFFFFFPTIFVFARRALTDCNLQ